MEQVDFLIVGQGIAGTMLTRQLLRRGATVALYDDAHKGASSAVAAGIINPVTGKNFVRSWRVHEFLPFALAEYADISSELGVEVYRMSNLLRAITSPQEENSWHSRTTDPLVSAYMLAKADLGQYTDLVHPALSYGELTGTCQVFMPALISGFARRWMDSGLLRKERFQYERLYRNQGKWVYGDVQADRVVFCEGSQAKGNPFFPSIGLAPTKGEVLHISHSGPMPEKMYKDGIFLVPQPDGSMWVGGGYSWQFQDAAPTQPGKQQIQNELSRLLKVPYTILRHAAAVRPTMQSRRPVFLAHKEKNGLFLFNGLGTKGASMAPLIATEIAEALTNAFLPASIVYT